MKRTNGTLSLLNNPVCNDLSHNLTRRCH